MATPNDISEDVMNPKRWFEEGGQQAELQRIGKIKNSEQQTEALVQFNDRNNAFMAERTAQAQPPAVPQPAEKKKTHPAIEEAIDDTMKKEVGWTREMAGLTDDQLRERRIQRHMAQDNNRGRLDPSIVTLSDYKVARPDLVDVVGKFTRTELERKETLTRMVQERRFNITTAKIEYERKLDPQLVKVAELNVAERGVHINSAKYNDNLYSEVSQVKRTLGNAKSVGFKI
jgi:hypothetical protein